MNKELQEDIYFYSRDEEYGWLSNFERSEQVVGGVNYQTNEHYYQSQKAKDPEIRKWIANAPIPFLAMKAGRAIRKKEMVEYWDAIKFDIMLRGLRAKFSQNQNLRNKLIATGQRKLHENSPNDLIWGVKGKDMLGKLIMQVRKELTEVTNSSQL